MAAINDDLHLQFLEVKPTKKKGSSDGSDESDFEQAQYFLNEEKVIRNHLKLNVGINFIQVILFILTLTILDWTHV